MLTDDPILYRAHVAAQHREHTRVAERRKDQQTQHQQVEILTASIRAGIAVAPDMFVGLDPRRAAELVVRELL